MRRHKNSVNISKTCEFVFTHVHTDTSRLLSIPPFRRFDRTIRRSSISPHRSSNKRLCSLACSCPACRVRQLTFIPVNVLSWRLQLKASQVFQPGKQSSDMESIPVACAMKRAVRCVNGWTRYSFYRGGWRWGCTSTSANTKYIQIKSAAENLGV